MATAVTITAEAANMARRSRGLLVKTYATAGRRPHHATAAMT